MANEYDVATMPVFAVVSLSDSNETLNTRVKEQFPNDHYVLASGRWLVAGEGIAKEISDKLGTAASVGTLFAVFAIGGYFGWAPNTVWEWMALKTLPIKR
jgi:hypothetical protein